MTRFSILFLCLFQNTNYQNDNLDKGFSNYEKERAQLNIPRYTYSYQANFANIASIDNLVLFKKFNLHKLFEYTSVPKFAISAWQNASPMTSPASYMPGQNRFVYNFSEGRQNVRTMDWLLIHEGIPGHHYQFSLRSKNRVKKPAFTENVSYSGNFEGWACYAENLGKELGQYQTPEEELSKWEWDLVRSLRLMLDVGLHYYGWSIEKAIVFWNEKIKGQDDIAYREIMRVIYWPGQSLSYKIGAMKIEEFKTRLHVTDKTIKKFHSVFLSFSSEPLAVIERSIGEMYDAR